MKMRFVELLVAGLVVFGAGAAPEIDYLYQEMLRALEGDHDTESAEFDAERHIPISFAVGDDDIADSGWGFRVTCFVTDGESC